MTTKLDDEIAAAKEMLARLEKDAPTPSGNSNDETRMTKSD